MRGELRDEHGRVMRDLRVSITDRCNFRCVYCLPETEEAANFYRTRFDAVRNPQPAALAPLNYEWKPKSEILRYEEIIRVVRIAASLGIRKVRITGGEPLLRRDVAELIRGIAGVPSIEDLALTTNGFLFAQQARALRDAGLRRVSISLDSLDRARFQRMTGRDGLAQAIEAIEEAQRVGFSPVKVNTVVIGGMNDHELESLVDFARRRGLVLRFIEFMPLDSNRAWQRERVVPGSQILKRLQARFPLVPISQDSNPAETARRWAFADGQGEIGIIAPVTQPFCGHCNRIRLTADGQVRTCLFSLDEHDLKRWLRDGATDDDLAERLRQIVVHKEPGHRIGQPDFVQPKRTMSCIGG
jgi:cyclic pyranopterin phosphate synthase